MQQWDFYENMLCNFTKTLIPEKMAAKDGGLVCPVGRVRT